MPMGFVNFLVCVNFLFLQQDDYIFKIKMGHLWTCLLDLQNSHTKVQFFLKCALMSLLPTSDSYGSWSGGFYLVSQCYGEFIMKCRTSVI